MALLLDFVSIASLRLLFFFLLQTLLLCYLSNCMPNNKICAFLWSYCFRQCIEQIIRLRVSIKRDSPGTTGPLWLLERTIRPHFEIYLAVKDTIYDDGKVEEERIVVGKVACDSYIIKICDFCCNPWEGQFWGVWDVWPAAAAFRLNVIFSCHDKRCTFILFLFF